MTNTLALILAFAVIGAVATDVVVYDSENLLFLGKKMMELIEYLAFWR